MPTELDYARLAAYIDGEGCIYLPAPGACSAAITVLVSNTDPRLPLWCKSVFGCGSIDNPKMKPWQLKKVYSWRASSRDAENILRNCLPYFTIKLDQAEIALEYRTTVNNSPARRYKLASEIAAKRVELRKRLANLRKDWTLCKVRGLKEPLACQN